MRRLLVMVLAVVSLCARAQEPQLTLHGTVTRAEYMTYQEVPFDVPPDTSRLTVDFTYTGHDQGTNLDMGVLDPERFRGWSGGNKHTFTISASDATPSYLPGPLPAGRWRLLVGVPAIRGGSTAQYTVKVWWTQTSDESSVQPTRSGPAWYRGDLHMHTAHSDGSCLSQAGVKVPCPVFLTVQAAAARGLDFIAVTDHKTTSHYDSLRELQPYFDRTLLIPGREITTFYGHANVFGTTHFIDFRLGTKSVPDMNHLLDAVEKAHGLIALNHPGIPSGEQCMGCGWTAPATDYARIHVMEAVNGPDADGDKSGVPVWQKQLNAGHHITAIGGSDNHNALLKPGEANAVGSPTTVVYAQSLSAADILAGVRAGHVFVDVDGTKDRMLTLTATQGAQTASMGDTLHVSPNGETVFKLTVANVEGFHAVLITDGDASPMQGTFASGTQNRNFSTNWNHVTTKAVPHVVRVEIRDAEGHLKLLGNPIYLQP